MAKFQVGQTVWVDGDGTNRFPIPTRYTGRRGVISSRQRVGRCFVYGVEFSGRRASPLPVTQTALSLAE